MANSLSSDWPPVLRIIVLQKSLNNLRGEPEQSIAFDIMLSRLEDAQLCDSSRVRKPSTVPGGVY